MNNIAALPAEYSDRWKHIITGLEYMLQFKKTPMEYVDLMCDAIVKKRGVNFSVEESIAALAAARKSDMDLATLLTQPHPDKKLREFFSALEEKLIETLPDEK